MNFIKLTSKDIEWEIRGNFLMTVLSVSFVFVLYFLIGIPTLGLILALFFFIFLLIRVKRLLILKEIYLKLETLRENKRKPWLTRYNKFLEGEKPINLLKRRKHKRVLNAVRCLGAFNSVHSVQD